MTYRHYLTTIISLMTFLSLCIGAGASDLDIPNTFTDGEPAYADQVNQNFQAVETAVDDNQQQIDGKLSNTGGTITGDLTVNGTLTASSINISGKKIGSVTYSAMGFTPYQSHNIEYFKDRDSGYLALSESINANFYHAVTLRSGVTMTRVRAHVRDLIRIDNREIEIKLRKKELGNDVVNLVKIESNDESLGTSEGIIQKALDTPEYIADSTQQVTPVSYFIEVNLQRQNVRLYSVTIDYEYSEP